MQAEAPIRVLHLVRALQPGGLERVVMDLLQGLPGYGVRCFLGCLFEPGAWAPQASTDATWVGGAHDRQGAWRRVQGLRRFLQQHRVDILHSHNPMPHAYAVAAAWGTRARVVHTKHGRNYPNQPRRVWLNRLLSARTAAVAAVSDDVANVATRIERVRKEKVTVIRNGVDMRRFASPDIDGARQAARRRLGLADDVLLVGSVGRLSEEKNYPLLVRAFARMATRGDPRPELLFVGDGPDRAGIQAEAEQCGCLNRCRFAGMQADVAPWLQAMDVFCLSSHTEGTSVTLLEAGACSLPSVVTAVGGNGEVVTDGTTGYVVPPGDADAMAGALNQLTADASLRARLGQAARERVSRQYSLDAMLHNYARLYREVLGLMAVGTLRTGP